MREDFWQLVKCTLNHLGWQVCVLDAPVRAVLVSGDQSLLALGTPVREGRAAPFPGQGGRALLHILNFHFILLPHNYQLGDLSDIFA